MKALGMVIGQLYAPYAEKLVYSATYHWLMALDQNWAMKINLYHMPCNGHNEIYSLISNYSLCPNSCFTIFEQLRQN